MTDIDPGDLKTQYFCSKTKDDKVDISVQLRDGKISNRRKLPVRYVLVMDTSGSMAGLSGNDNHTRLDRVKVFINMVIKKMSSEDSAAIVQFDHDAQCVLPMTKMSTMQDRERALQAVDLLSTGGGTNVESGLIEGLEACEGGEVGSRDCMILLTDGETSENAAAVIQKYKQTSKRLNRRTCVPVSAFVLGDVKAHFLLKISKELGSEAFYWLNEQGDFEAELFMPVFLRQRTRLTDIKIQFQPQNGVTIIEKEHQSVGKEFLHALPDGIVKKYLLTLSLNGRSKKDLLNKNILVANYTCIDENGNLNKKEDTIQYYHKSLNEYSDAKNLAHSTEQRSYLNATTAYSLKDGILNYKWSDALKSIAEVSKQTCNSILSGALKVYVAVGTASAYTNRVYEEAKTQMDSAAASIRFLAKGSAANNPIREFIEFCDDAQVTLNHATEICKKLKHNATPRLSAMFSSVSKDMPTSNGVFKEGQKQRNNPEYLQIRMEDARVKIQNKEEDLMEDSDDEIEMRVITRQIVIPQQPPGNQEKAILICLLIATLIIVFLHVLGILIHFCLVLMGIGIAWGFRDQLSTLAQNFLSVLQNNGIQITQEWIRQHAGL